MVINAFWQNKRVLVTGHTGFKGSWLSLWLQQLGAKVAGFALLPNTEPNLFELANVAANMQSHIGDVRDYAAVHALIKKFKPEIIFHLAAQPLVRYSYENPAETYAVNVMGTVNVLEAAKHCDAVRAVVNVTSDKCYENKEWLWGYRENEAMGGFDPYSSSKGCSELVTSSYRNSFYNELGKGLASARAGNVIGGGDWASDRLIPDVINSFIHQEKVLLRYPNAIRPWQHVLEPLAGYLCLAEKLYNAPSEYNQAWNFGPSENDMVTVGALVEKLATQWGDNVGWQTMQNNEQPHEAHYLKLDISKARSLLDWQPTLTIDDSITWIVDWYQTWLANDNMAEKTIAQINLYHQKSGVRS